MPTYEMTLKVTSKEPLPIKYMKKYIKEAIHDMEGCRNPNDYMFATFTKISLGPVYTHKKKE